MRERGDSRTLEVLIWAAAFAIHVLFWVSLRTQWLSPLFYDATHPYGPACDFFAVYQAGHSALSGQSVFQWEKSGTVIPYGYPFRYLPVVAYTVGALLALVSPTTAYVIWLASSELILIYNIRLTQRLSGGGVRGAWLGLVWLGFAPLYVHMWLGQFTLLLASLLFWSVLAYEQKDYSKAQVLWVLSVLWKPASLLWLPIWIREKRFLAWGAALALLLVANGAYFHWFPADLPHFIDANLKSIPLWCGSNVGMSAAIWMVTGPGVKFTLVRYLVNALVILPALYVTFRTQPEERDRVWLLGAIWSAAFFLIYKEVWEQHLVLLVPFLVLSLLRARSLLLVALVVILSLPTPSVFYDVRGLRLGEDAQPHFGIIASTVHHTWRVLPIIVLFGYWIHRALAARPGSLRAGSGTLRKSRRGRASSLSGASVL